MSVATAERSLEVFQGLRLRGPAEGRVALRKALLARVAVPWDRPDLLMASIVPGFDMLVFRRAAEEGFAATHLCLQPRPDGYEVTNIVPLIEDGQLDPGEYNAVLQDFMTRIAVPAAREAGFVVEMTASRQSLEDWLTPRSAMALRAFTVHANKGMGSAHPRDRERWFRFLMLVHADKCPLGTEQLSRWLTEIGGWNTDMAHELVVEYGFGLALLDEYDLQRA